MVHLFVVYGCQGAEGDPDQLKLTDKLLQAVLAEAQVVCIGQPLLINGDLNADPPVIPCLPLVFLLVGLWTRLWLAPLGLVGSQKLLANSSWMSVLVLVGILSWVVLMRWLLPLLAGPLIGGFLLNFLCYLPLVLRNGRLRFPALLFPSLCGLHAGLTLLIGHLLLYLVLFRMPGMCIGMNLVYLLRLYLLSGMRGV